MIRYPVMTLIFAFGFATLCSSQKKDEYFSPSLALRTNPFSVLEVDGGIMLGVRYQWSQRFAAVIDPTFIFFNFYQNTNSNVNGQPIGIKIRSDIRYYLNRYVPGRNRFFIAPELHLKYITTKKWDNFGINCIGQQCDYYMNAMYKEIKKETGAALKMGAEVRLDKKDLWSFEIYGGLGFKIYHLKQKDIPVGGVFTFPPENNNVFEFQEGTAIPVLPASIKIAYKIF